MKLKNNQKGYTIIELLAVLVVMVSVGVVITSVLFTSLRGTGKSTITNEIRQNGNYAINQMSRMIEFSQIFGGVSTDGINYSANCVPEVPPSPTPSPAIVQYSHIKVTSFDNVETIFSCSGDPLTIASNGASLVDSERVAVTACYFTCTQVVLTEPPIINIYFTVSDKNANLVENQAVIPFETAVSMKNLR